MDIQGTTLLVLGGGGMVGRAVCREFIKAGPYKIVISSLLEEEAKEAVESLQEEVERLRKLDPYIGRVRIVAEWGNIFAREPHKHMTGAQALQSAEGRHAIIEDTLEPMSTAVARRFFLYQMIIKYRPQVIVDAVNTATGIAYSDIFSQARRVWGELSEGPPSRGAEGGVSVGVQAESVERLLCSLYIPQLIRHVDVLYRAMVAVDTKAYLKLGTSGTGGMGWNIPYTHGEERPSALLLSKSAVAGAHTLLLFLLARTPGIASLEHEADGVLSKPPPTTMEIKPTAMIGWRAIGHGDIVKRGQPIFLEKVSLAQAEPVEDGQVMTLQDPSRHELTDRKLRTVFVDTGENGMFSTEEFIAITSPGQMEFVTPEEIARNVADEIRGVNTGKDIINALNVTCMGPTYRAGFQRERAIQRLRDLERQHGCDSVAFENLGPPRLSKLLFEVYLIKRCHPTLQQAAAADPQELQKKILEILEADADLLATPVTLGVPILLEQDGKPRLLRGRLVKTPPPAGVKSVRLEHAKVEEWARAGWIDLRLSNLALWKRRLERIVADADSIPSSDTSSRYVRDREFWSQSSSGDWDIRPGEIVAWIFINEDKGERGRE